MVLETNQPVASSQARQDLIKSLEAARDSKVITYFLSDRPAAPAQISGDAVRPMYDHLRAVDPGKKIDLFIYSAGGSIEVPWRIVSMIREFTENFSVLIPYKAMSAATLIALGADEVVMGRKAELGPIDPQLTMQRGGEGGTAVQERMSVEDIMSFIRFVREKAGLSDQAALAQPISVLTNKLNPWTLGEINRIHTHIRELARKLLLARKKEGKPDEQRIQLIIETLAEKTYLHGHAIGRTEAEDIRLIVVRPDAVLEEAMWTLYKVYEELCQVVEPIDPRTFVAETADERTEEIVMGCIESVAFAHHFTAQLKGTRKRQAAPQIALNLNLNLQLPAGVDMAALPAATQEAIQQLLQALQQNAQALIHDEVKKQMPVTGYEMWTQNGAWRPISDWPG